MQRPERLFTRFLRFFRLSENWKGLFANLFQIGVVGYYVINGKTAGTANKHIHFKIYNNASFFVEHSHFTSEPNKIISLTDQILYIFVFPVKWKQYWRI